MARFWQRERTWSLMDVIDGGFFAFSALAALWLAYLLVHDGLHNHSATLLLIVFWVFFSYLVLPRLHRVLTLLYVPDYFLGRTRTSDGLLGDPVNLGLRGDEGQVRAAMESAGWILADQIDLRSSTRITTSTLRRRSYPQAPVSPLILFDRPQDFSYQQEVAGNPSQRHHVRFWRCPEGWMLPGGFEVDWLAAGTFDRRVGLSLFTLQITHKIDANTDVERDFIVETVSAAEPAVRVDVIRNFSSGYHARNGGGDRINTDGDLPILDVGRLDGIPVAEPSDSRSRRPVQTVIGASIAFARGLYYILLALLVIVAPETLDLTNSYSIPSDEHTLRVAALIVTVLAAVVDLALVAAVLAGRNWARLALMSACAISTITAFVDAVGGDRSASINSLPTIGGGILVLLALSSHRAREYATVPRRTSPRVPA